MKTVKVGQLNFWSKEGEDTGIHTIGEYLIPQMNNYSTQYKFEFVENCYENE